jgi:hypothetical protein
MPSVPGCMAVIKRLTEGLAAIDWGSRKIRRQWALRH